MASTMLHEKCCNTVVQIGAPVDSGGGEVFILCPGYFSYCHVFPMVSALDYSLLKHVVINDDL